MPEAVGLLLLAPLGLAETAGIAGLGTLAGTTIGGIGIATAVGSAAILGASIGLQYALRPNAPGLPPPESGSQPIKQAIPPRIRGYGLNRLAGYYMLFEAVPTLGRGPPANSYDVMAFHSGRIGSVVGFYLHDDPVLTTSDISHGGVGIIANTYADSRYSGYVVIEVALGSSPQSASSLITSDPAISSIWTSAFQGNGIAWAAMKCIGAHDAPTFTTAFPHQLPVLSVLAKCSVIWDPRDPAQIPGDQSTWQVSYNPVIQLIDYLTRADGGVGLDYDTIIAPNLAAWLAEADLCDELVPTATGTEPRYASNGWFQFDNAPADVIGGILSTCDGWLAESGDGALSITVGVYRAPTDPPLTEKHIFGFALNYGQTDEQTINELDISFIDPASKYVSVQTDPWRDEAAISLTGVLRTQALDLKWVQSNSQARRLADRAMQRLNPAMTGSFTTSLYGLRYLGKRWVPIQYPFVSGLQNSVVEIQSAEVDLMAGNIVWNFNLIGSNIESYNPSTDQGAAPVIPPSTLLNISDDAGNILTDDLLAPLTLL
jgi:hypothetical protein